MSSQFVIPGKTICLSHSWHPHSAALEGFSQLQPVLRFLKPHCFFRDSQGREPTWPGWDSSDGCGQQERWNKPRGRGGTSSAPENELGFSQGTCAGSERPGTRRSGNKDQEHLEMGRRWSKKESGDLEIEKCWRSGVEKVSRRSLGAKRTGARGG